MKAVSEVGGVARSNLHIRAQRAADWTDRRRHRRPQDDQALVDEHRFEVAAFPSYGYRRAWTMVNRRHEREGRPRVNHKRVYRVMREHRLLLARHTGRPLELRSACDARSTSRSRQEHSPHLIVTTPGLYRLLARISPQELPALLE